VKSISAQESLGVIKTAVSEILVEALNFVDSVNFSRQPSKSAKIRINQNSEPLNVFK